MHRHAAAVLIVLLSLALSSCRLGGSTRSSESRPQAKILILADRNRFIWLSAEDDDLTPMNELLLDAANSASAVRRSQVSTRTVYSVQQTGRMMSASYQGANLRFGNDVANLHVAIRPGETTLTAGDVIVSSAGRRYEIVGRLGKAEFERVAGALSERMGLD